MLLGAALPSAGVVLSACVTNGSAVETAADHTNPTATAEPVTETPEPVTATTEAGAPETTSTIEPATSTLEPTTTKEPAPTATKEPAPTEAPQPVATATEVVNVSEGPLYEGRTDVLTHPREVVDSNGNTITGPVIRYLYSDPDNLRAGEPIPKMVFVNPEKMFLFLKTQRQIFNDIVGGGKPFYALNTETGMQEAITIEPNTELEFELHISQNLKYAAASKEYKPIVLSGSAGKDGYGSLVVKGENGKIRIVSIMLPSNSMLGNIGSHVSLSINPLTVLAMDAEFMQYARQQFELSKGVTPDGTKQLALKPEWSQAEIEILTEGNTNGSTREMPLRFVQ